eukprot:2754126-Pyramimonas_sp.AAC.1
MLPKLPQHAGQCPMRGPSPLRRALEALVGFLTQVSSDKLATGSVNELAKDAPFVRAQELRGQIDSTPIKERSENDGRA